MNLSFARALPLVLKHEGGWADHPSDPGGATMKGITIATYRRYINAKGTKADLRNITNEQVADVYRRQYWNAVEGDSLPSGVDYAVFDFAVNSGPGRAVKYLQAACGVAQDGKIGTQTLTAVAKQNPAALINSLCDARLSFMRRIKNPKTGALLWQTFGKGWSSRVAGVRKEALRMAGEASPAPEQPVAPASDDSADAGKMIPAKPPVGFPVEPGTVVVIKDGSKPKPEGLLWRPVWWVLGGIFSPPNKDK